MVKNKLQQLTLAGLVLATGAVLAATLMLTEPAPAREELPEVVPMVEVIKISQQNIPIKIVGYGTVQPTIKAQIVPQVEGRVIAVHKNLFSGGFVAQNTPLVTIDPSDYELDLEASQAQLRQAQAALIIAQIRIVEAQTNLTDATQDLERIEDLYEKGVLSRRDADKAQTMWKLNQVRVEKEQAELTNAKSRLGGARVVVSRAKLNRARTQIILPFNAIVLSERVDPGQYVLPGQSIGEAYGTSTMEIPVPLKDQQLKWLPGLSITSQKNLSQLPLHRAEIKGQFAGKERHWQGTVVRTNGQIDPQSRMIDVVVRVDNKFDVQSNQLPLLPGTFAEVIIHGSILENIFPIPHYAVHDNNQLWIFEEGKLHIKKVHVAHRDREWVYASEGIKDGQQIIVTPMDLVTDGMAVHLKKQ